MFFGDREPINENISKAESLVDQGGDWDRRNRLKVYRGVQLLSIRQFKRASELLIDSLRYCPTLAHNSFPDGMELKKRVRSASIPTCLSNPRLHLISLRMPIHQFFQALASLEQTHLLPSRLLSPHARFYVREMRILAYSQLLESYRSLTLDSLADAFGVSVEFVDRDLSRFIASNRLNCTIDAVRGVVETTRPSTKNAQYETVIRT
ncbi:unnamed protein product, partial [Rhizoctonia solani]